VNPCLEPTSALCVTARVPQPYLVERLRHWWGGCGLYGCGLTYPCEWCRERHIVAEARPAVLHTVAAMRCCDCAQLFEPSETEGRHSRHGLCGRCGPKYESCGMD